MKIETLKSNYKYFINVLNSFSNYIFINIYYNLTFKILRGKIYYDKI